MFAYSKRQPLSRCFYATLSYFCLFVNSTCDKGLYYGRMEDIKMKPLKEKISITIDGDLLEKLKIKAEEDDRSLSQYINLALKDHIKRLENDA